ncbi:unnamed protein product [Amaranthus hypochondriacus]
MQVFTVSSMLITQLIMISLIVVPSSLSKAENANYKACSTVTSCGKIKNIGYPFWGGVRPEFCGVSELKLNCLTNADYPTISVYKNGDIGLSVVNINSTSQIISVSRQNLLERCYLQDISKYPLLSTLNPKPGYQPILLFYGCRISKGCFSKYKKYYSFPCSNSNGSFGSAYYFDNISNYSLFSESCTCINNVTALIDKRGLEELRNNKNGSLWNVMTKWPMQLKYSVNISDCEKCKASGGRCGSDAPLSHGFKCICRVDGAHPFGVCTSRSGVPRKLIIIISGSVALALAIVMLISFVVYAHKGGTTEKFSFLRSKSKDPNVIAFLNSYGSLVPKRYTYIDIRKMTNSFKHKLGEGGYGSVYKGKLQDGRFVAVKKLKTVKGDCKDFITEVLSISRTNHVNIVTLLGFCFERDKRALVFEFLPNGSLEKFICDGEIGNCLQWETMFDIAIGIARGLDYLHRGCNTRILHFDIKPHNILLDEDFHPKISDFGLARLCPPKNSLISMSEAIGTIGYIAPEVLSKYFGNVSHKSDVYSYGMMLLDLVCGRKKKMKDNDVEQSNEMYFPDWLYKQLEEDEEIGVGVHKLMNDRNKELERKMLIVSLWCIKTYPLNRPSMNKVVEMLEGPLESLQIPAKPNTCSPVRPVFDSSSMSDDH